MLLDPFHLLPLCAYSLPHSRILPHSQVGQRLQSVYSCVIKSARCHLFPFLPADRGLETARQTPDKQAVAGRDGEEALPVGCRADGHLADALTTSHFCFIFITFLFVAAVAVLIALVVVIVAGINLFCLVSKE